MGRIYEEVGELTGNTPLLHMRKLEERYQLPATILAKLEYLNPSGSIKDRAALAMIRDAEERGQLKPGATIIEPTSGNTGIGLASVGIARGYQVRRNILKAYGAKIVLTEGAMGMKGAIEKAEELQREIPDSFIPGQFDNPANARIHREMTGPEIWEDTDGEVG